MEPKLWLSILFGAGLLFETLLLLRQKLDYKKTLGIILFLFLSLLVSFLKWEGGSIYKNIFAAFLVFALFVGIIFKDEILPKISEAKLLSFTVSFWFVFLTPFQQNMYYLNLVGAVAIIPTVLTLIIGFFTFELNRWLKLLLYLWFLIINTTLLFTQISFRDFLFFFDATVAAVDFIAVFVAGMSFMIIVTNLFYLWLLIPFLPYEGTIKERRKEWKEHITGMIKKFSDYQIKPSYSLLLLLLQGGGFILNYYYRFFPSYFLINLWIVLIPQVLQEKPVITDISKLKNTRDKFDLS